MKTIIELSKTMLTFITGTLIVLFVFGYSFEFEEQVTDIKEGVKITEIKTTTYTSHYFNFKKTEKTEIKKDTK